LLPVALCLLTGVATLAPAPSRAEEKDPSRLTLESIFEDEKFEVEAFGPARWFETGSGYTVLEASPDFDDAKDVVLYDPVTGDRSVLVPASSLIPPGGKEPLTIEDYHWSEDGERLLIFTNTERVWRRNTRGDYWLFEIEGGVIQRLGGDSAASSMMFAKLSPDQTRVAWVDFHQKDLYVQELDSLEVTRLTAGQDEHIINGTSDWVYEEEFGLRDGFRWAPDSSRVAFWQFNSEGVGIFNLINNTDTLYPELTPIPYPKVGTTNSACRIGVIPASGGDITWFEPDGDPRNHYIPKMGWMNGSAELWLIQLNRLQNTARMMLGDIDSGHLTTIFTDRDDAWIEIPDDDPMWVEEGRFFTWLSERDGWRHLYLVSRSGDEVRLVTAGDYDVIELVHVDIDSGHAYFTASPDDPTSRYLYRVPLSGHETPERVTPIGPAGTHSYQISDDGSWAIHTYSSRDHVPRTDLISLPDHIVQQTLEDNTEVRNAFAAIARPPFETFRVDIGDDVEIDSWMIKPPDFEPTASYPLLIYVYGEPAGQTVRNRWGGNTGMWHIYLAQKGYIVASLDNRGTPASRGRQWRKSVYRQIGILASIDQAAGVQAMFEKYPFIDRQRVGVWGWSGGGSMTLNLLFRYPEIYSAGISVAPVPDQHLYDTVYQERYMGLPEDNVEGFAEGSPITHGANLEGDLLLVHGTGDDNVHYQGLERLINELVKHGKLFDLMSYPNRSHGISEGEGTSLHLRRTMTRFLEEHLEAGPKPMLPPRVPDAVSFLGQPLFAPAPSAESIARYEDAKETWEGSPTDADAIIWYGRRAAYLGHYRDAIRIYSDGIELHPEDARLYRHRGHRFISTRQLDKAIADLDHAAALIEGASDEVEPDGLPNPLGIPVSTLHSNIWYHLGLAYYLAGDYERAEQAYAQRMASAGNNDMLVSTAHWRYMTLRRLGRKEEALAILKPITADMEIIENRAYHRLCLFYKGELDEMALQGEGSTPSDAAVAYGFANWHLAEGDTELGISMLEEIVARDGWAAFGFIAAEADLARIRNSEF
jgi:dipeptidyl-peptidase-4